MNANILPSDRATLVTLIAPDAHTIGAKNSGYVDMRKFHAIQAIVLAGTLGSSATIDAKLTQSKDASGGSEEDITGKAITQITASDKQAIINIRSDELKVNEGFTHVRLVLTVGTATSDAGAVVLGHDARYQPAAGPASLVEVVG